MTKDEVFKIIQQYTIDVPLLLVGTGGTIPYGIPGMKQLSDHLISTLNERYKTDAQWDKFIANIKDGLDLESALTNLSLEQNILNDIVIQTWFLINNADLKLLNQILDGKKILPIAKLIKKFYQPQPQCVNILTTNYDRVIEYACDQIHAEVDKRFMGYYIKYFNNSHLRNRNTVNLIKVHGSLDLFRDKGDYVYSIPLQRDIPIGFIPEIVTPGENKYRTILNGECRDLVHIADDLINNAKSYLCIGYGFNDEQIQRNIISGIKQDKPVVVVTKKISEKATSLISNNSDKYVIVQEDPTDKSKTQFIVNDKYQSIDGTYWPIEGFLEII